jgi:hypothetical protein
LFWANAGERGKQRQPITKKKRPNRRIVNTPHDEEALAWLGLSRQHKEIFDKKSS